MTSSSTSFNLLRDLEQAAERAGERAAEQALQRAAKVSAPAEQPRKWLTTKQAAEYLGVSTSTLEHWRIAGKGPRYVKTGRMVRYDRDVLDAFMNGGA